MATNISAVSSSTIAPTTQASTSTSESRISSAQKLSVTPESQMDLAAIFSLSGEVSEPTDPGLGSLIYNASVSISGTSDKSLPKTGLVEEQIQSVIDAYSPESEK